MIRPFTCICMIMAAGSGLYLYQTKHRAQLLDRELARTYRQIDQTKERIGLLKGEWALLNEPDRLNELAQQHLALKTLAPTQFAALADLGSRLPAPLPRGSFTVPADVPAAVPVAVPGAASPPAASPAASTPIAAAKPVASAPKLVATNDKPGDKPSDKPAAAVPQASAPVVVASAQALRPAARAAVAAPTQAPAAPHLMAPIVAVSAGAIRPAAQAPGSIGESVARHMQVQQPGTSSGMQPGVQAGASPIPTFAQAATPYAGMGSVLGGVNRVPLPAPVPYGAAASR